MYVLRQNVEAGDYPRVVLVHTAQPEEGERFFAQRWPAATALADPEGKLYAAFGLRRGSVGQLIGPKAMWAGLRGLLSGHGVGKPQGDTLMLSGRFLIHEDRVLWSDLHEHAGAGTEDGEMLAVFQGLSEKT